MYCKIKELCIKLVITYDYIVTVWGRLNVRRKFIHWSSRRFTSMSPPGCHYNGGELASLKASLTF